MWYIQFQNRKHQGIIIYMKAQIDTVKISVLYNGYSLSYQIPIKRIVIMHW